MEWLQSLLDSSSVPIITAFLLGVLTAVSPCPLATNITAIGYISKDIDSKHRILWNGLIYTFGRVLAYTALGVIVIYILRQGESVFKIQKAVSQYSEMLIAPLLVVIGLFMLFGEKLHLPKFGFSGNGENLKKRGGLGALLLGVLFALAFCPSSGVFYFGMLIPMSVTAQGGYLLPAVFAIATGLPVIVVAWILAYSVSSLGKFYNKMQLFQKWFNRIVAILFLIIGVYYFIVLYV